MSNKYIIAFEKDNIITKETILALAVNISNCSEWWFPAYQYFVDKPYINTDIFTSLIKIDHNFTSGAYNNEEWQEIAIKENIESFRSMIRYHFTNISLRIYQLAYSINKDVIKFIPCSKHKELKD